MDGVGEESDLCRICRLNGNEEKPLFCPCACSGSIKYIHQECLLNWLLHGGKQRCEVCKHQYSFRSVYSLDMPAHLPYRFLLFEVLKKTSKSVRLFFHFCFLLTVWLILLPVITTRLILLLYVRDLLNLKSLPTSPVRLHWIVLDVFCGYSFIALSMGGIVVCVWFRKLVSRLAGLHWFPHPYLQAFAALRTVVYRNYNDNPDIQVLLGIVCKIRRYVRLFAHRIANRVEDNMNEANELSSNSSSEDLSDDDNDGIVVLSANNLIINGVELLVFADDGIGWFNEHGTAIRRINWTGQDAERSLDVDRPVEDGNSDNALASDTEEIVNDLDEVDDVEDNAEILEIEQEEVPAHEEIPLEGNLHNALDRAEMTWNRLFGFDGTFFFLENAVYILSITLLMITVFAFTPYHIGHFILVTVNLHTKCTSFNGEVLSTAVEVIVGYLAIANLLRLLHFVQTRFFSFKRACHYSALGYLFLKIVFFILFDAFFMPLCLGLLLDVSTLSMFKATISQRKEMALRFPLMFVFAHWLIAVPYCFCFTWLIRLFCKIGRNGLVCSLLFKHIPQSLPDMFHKMINFSVFWLLLGEFQSLLFASTIILLTIYLPVECISHCKPDFYPFAFRMALDTPLDLAVNAMEVFRTICSLLIITNVDVLRCSRTFLNGWLQLFVDVFQLRSYILGNESFNAGDEVILGDGRMVRLNADISCWELHHAFVRHYSRRLFRCMLSFPTCEEPLYCNCVSGRLQTLQLLEPAHYSVETPLDKRKISTILRLHPYRRTGHLRLRLTLFCFSQLFLLILFSMVLLFVPMQLARTFMRKLYGFVPTNDVACIELVILTFYLLYRFLYRLHRFFGVYLRRRELRRFQENVRFLCLYGFRIVMATFLFCGLIPYYCGAMINYCFIFPLCMPSSKTVLYTWAESWLIGLFAVKTLIILNFVLPRFGWAPDYVEPILEELERRDGIRLSFLFALVKPALAHVTFLLFFPDIVEFVLAKLMVAWFGWELHFLQYLYPLVLAVYCVVVCSCVSVILMRKLYQSIRDEKYLIGKQLVNYHDSDT